MEILEYVINKVLEDCDSVNCEKSEAIEFYIKGKKDAYNLVLDMINEIKIGIKGVT